MLEYTQIKNNVIVPFEDVNLNSALDSILRIMRYKAKTDRTEITFKLPEGSPIMLHAIEKRV